MEKTVLVKMGQHNRLISFSTPITSPSTTVDVKVLKETIQDKFADVLQPGQKFFLQVKNEEWDEFLDLQGKEKIANKSTIKAVIIETPPSVTQCGMEPAPSQITQSMAACPGRVQGAESGNTSAIKLVFVGETRVGKTNLLLRFTMGEFQENNRYTIGAAFTPKTVSYDNTDVELIIWDTAGQERYHSLAPMYYRGAHAAIVVYDITNQDTFTKAKEWINKVKSLASPDVIIALAGNKADLEAHRRVDSKEAKAYAEENDLIFFETSAKDDMNVEEIFRAIVKKVPKTVVTQQRVEVDGRSLRVLGAEAQPEKTKRRCSKSS